MRTASLNSTIIWPIIRLVTEGRANCPSLICA
jgi:hypothetical protein